MSKPRLIAARASSMSLTAQRVARLSSSRQMRSSGFPLLRLGRFPAAADGARRHQHTAMEHRKYESLARILRQSLETATVQGVSHKQAARRFDAYPHEITR